MSFMEYDSPIMAGIGKVIDIIWLSTLWFICCLPIVTIGASTTALYYTSVKAIRDDSFRFFITTVYGCLAFVVLSVGCYAFPVVSRCSMKCFEVLRFSVGLMVKHFPYTILMVLTVLLCVAAMWYIPLFVFCLPVAGTLLFSIFMEKVLIRYTPEAEKCGWYEEK